MLYINVKQRMKHNICISHQGNGDRQSREWRMNTQMWGSCCGSDWVLTVGSPLVVLRAEDTTLVSVWYMHLHIMKLDSVVKPSDIQDHSKVDEAQTRLYLCTVTTEQTYCNSSFEAIQDRTFMMWTSLLFSPMCITYVAFVMIVLLFYINSCLALQWFQSTSGVKQLIWWFGELICNTVKYFVRWAQDQSTAQNQRIEWF